MLLTQKKNQYAIRAIYELAKRRGQGPIKISDIAKAQAIPQRFLEVILGQLKGSGFIESRRGFYGGYLLTRSPDKITVGDIFSHLGKRTGSGACLACEANGSCPTPDQCAFLPMWNQVRDAVFSVFNATTIQDLIDNVENGALTPASAQKEDTDEDLGDENSKIAG